MFWIGLGVGLVLGSTIGFIMMSIFIVGSRSDNDGDN